MVAIGNRAIVSSAASVKPPPAVPLLSELWKNAGNFSQSHTGPRHVVHGLGGGAGLGAGEGASGGRGGAGGVGGEGEGGVGGTV